MKSLKSFCLLVLITTLSGCGGCGGGNTQTIAKIDIVGAASLFIASGSASTSEVGVNEGTSTVSKLFKITPDGYVEEVTYTDEEGNSVTTQVEPVGVYNVNADYVIVTFGFDVINPQESYLVRKDDGAVYRITFEQALASPIKMLNYFKNASPVVADASNNIYFYGSRHDEKGSNTVYKITNPGTNPFIEDYIPAADSAYTFSADNSGNIFYYGRSIGSDSEVDRIKKLNGGLDNFSPHDWAYWKAANGSMYYLDYNDITSDTQIKKITVDSGFNVIETNYGASSNTGDLWFTPEFSYLLNVSDSTLVIVSQTGSLKVIDVYNDTDTPVKIDLSGVLNSITVAASSDDYYYIAGNNTANKGVLKKCNVNHVCSNLLTAGQYDIYAMVVSSNNDVTFNALRMSDGAKIIATVDDSGTITVLDETLNTQVTMLERIN